MFCAPCFLFVEQVARSIFSPDLLLYFRIGSFVSFSVFGWVSSVCPAGVAGFYRGLSSANVALYVRILFSSFNQKTIK
jgi:hypothetical protein